jgi:tetratricopeptide (TPR) repeat protein
MRILNTGDMVDIVEYIDDRLQVQYDSVAGELDRNVLIDLNGEVAEAEHFVFARGYFDEGEYEKSARLLDIFIRYFDDSPYLAEALYYLGQAYEAMANTNGNDSIPPFLKNERIGQRYYNGDSYRILLKSFPDSPFAAKAQYRLINLFRMSTLPWEDAVEPIEKELAMWDTFCTQYQLSDEYVLGLSEIGYLNRILFEITGEPSCREEAIATFEEIRFKYPGTVHAAYAIVHLYELENNEKIYKY